MLYPGPTFALKWPCIKAAEAGGYVFAFVPEAVEITKRNL
jgi:hypothetical protein